jgi:hypothetical protein
MVWIQPSVLERLRQGQFEPRRRPTPALRHPDRRGLWSPLANLAYQLLNQPNPLPAHLQTGNATAQAKHPLFYSQINNLCYSASTLR